MKIKFINHSCFIIEHNGVKIICDPWLEGEVFNRGWKHISETKFAYDDFHDIDYIWFSHEHPDHFNPPDIKKIPAEFRSKIKVLFHKTTDKRVAAFCSKSGFAEIIEMESNQPYKLGDDFEVFCSVFGTLDSWILFKSRDLTIFNANDCGIRNKNDALKLKKQIGKIDVLLTQFSYAYWAGNEEDIVYRQKVADGKLAMLKFQCEMFQPQVVIPIASFIYFCHEENFYLNDSVNTARKTYDFILENVPNVQPVILYNQDEYVYPNAHNSNISIEKYEKDFQKIQDKTVSLLKSSSVSKESLLQSAEKFISEVKNTGWLVRFILKPTKIFVKDYDQAFRLSMKGFGEITAKESDCDVSIASDSLEFSFKFPFGLDTTQINGRLRKPKNGKFPRFSNFFRVEQLKSHGVKWDLKHLSGVLARKVKFKLGLRVP